MVGDTIQIFPRCRQRQIAIYHPPQIPVANNRFWRRIRLSNVMPPPFELCSEGVA